MPNVQTVCKHRIFLTGIPLEDHRSENRVSFYASCFWQSTSYPQSLEEEIWGKQCWPHASWAAGFIVFENIIQSSLWTRLWSKQSVWGFWQERPECSGWQSFGYINIVVAVENCLTWRGNTYLPKWSQTPVALFLKQCLQTGYIFGDHWIKSWEHSC